MYRGYYGKWYIVLIFSYPCSGATFFRLSAATENNAVSSKKKRSWLRLILYMDGLIMRLPGLQF